MSKKFWQKLKDNPILLIFLGGLIVAALILAIPFLKQNNNWIWLLVLLCPLAHFFMMKNMHKNHHDHENRNKDDEPTDRYEH